MARGFGVLTGIDVQSTLKRKLAWISGPIRRNTRTKDGHDVDNADQSS
jgi:hypothetical protein